MGQVVQQVLEFVRSFIIPLLDGFADGGDGFVPVDEHGMRAVMLKALEGVDDNTHLHVSFDLDCLDPDIAPGVGTAVLGGPTYREAQLCMEMIADTGRLSSIDIVELNPALDLRNQTATLAVDLIESLFGKSTLVRMAGK